MKKLFKILMILLLLVIIVIAGGFTYLKTAFPKDGKVEEVTINKNDTALVARGKYLVEAVSGCTDCHSPRNIALFGAPVYKDSLGKGGFKFTRDFEFPGTIYSKNITPAAIGKWTDAQLYHAVTTGVNPDGEVLFPLMPYTHIGKADPEDVKAMLAYIRTLKPIEGSYPAHDLEFPVNLMVRMAPEPAQPGKRPSESDTLAYGTYLFNLGACNECHTPRDNKGNFIDGLTMAGGHEFKLQGMGTVRSANLTPDRETGIGNWTKEKFIETFKFFDNPENQKIPWQKRGYQTVMPWLAHSAMTPNDLAALYKYLRTLQPVKHLVVKWTPAGEQSAAK
jgi:mono/diheme cytochrome c family protein